MPKAALFASHRYRALPASLIASDASIQASSAARHLAHTCAESSRRRARSRRPDRSRASATTAWRPAGRCWCQLRGRGIYTPAHSEASRCA